MASIAATRVNLPVAKLEPFKDNASALEVIIATDDTCVVQFTPNTILQTDGSQLSDLPMDRLLSLLLEVCDNAIPREETNKELGLVMVILAANKGSGDVALQDIRKRRTIVGRAFEFLVASTTTSGALRSDMQRAVLVTSHTFSYLAAPDDPALGEHPHPPTRSDPLHPPHQRRLSRRARPFSANKDAEVTPTQRQTTGDDGGVIHSYASGARTDSDIPKQVS